MQLLFENVNLRIGFIPQAAEYLTALWMGVYVIRLNQAARDQLPHQGMIGCQLIKLLSSYHVGAAIAYIDNVRMFPCHHKTGDSGTHVGFILRIFLAEGVVS